MRERTVSTLLIVPVVVTAILLGGVGVGLLAVVLAILAAREAERLLPLTGRPVIHGGIVGGAGLLVAAAAVPAILRSQVLGRPSAALGVADGFVAIDGSVLVGVVAVGLALASLARRDPASGFSAWSATLFGSVYVGLLGSVAILATQGTGAAPDVGTFLAERRWVVVLLAGVWGFDSGAYVVGRAIGRRPFFPWISPKKTLEGVVGGLAAGTVAVAAVLAVMSANPLEAVVLGPLLGVAAQAGDLAESLLKRAAGVKDSGALLPGHGGILDRVDSILFAAPALAAWVTIVHG